MDQALRHFLAREGASVMSSPLLLALAAIALPLPVTSTDDALQRFNREAKLKWNEYAMRTRLFSGSSEQEFDIGGQVTNRKFRYKQNGVATVIEADLPASGGSPFEALGFNSKYRFTVKKQRKNDPWAIGDVFLFTTQEKRENDAQHAAARGVFKTLVQHSYNGDLSELFSQKAMKLESAGYVGSQRDRVRVKFVLDPSLGPIPHNLTIRSGEMEFAPDRYWCLTECMLAAQQPGGTAAARTRKSFRLAEDAVPIPTETVDEFTIAGAKGDTLAKITRRFTLEISRPSPDEQEYTLSAFGLDEPHGVEWPRPTPWWLYAPLAGLTLILAGFLVRRFTNRRAAPAA